MATMHGKRFRCAGLAARSVAVGWGVLGAGALALGQTTRPTTPPVTAPAGATTTAGTEPVLHPSSREAQLIELYIGESRTLDAPWPVKRVSVAQPDIADVDASSPSRIQFQGRSVGLTELMLEGEQGQIWRARLDVKADTTRLQGQLRKLFANSSLEVSQINDLVVVKGMLARAEDAAQLRQFLTLSKLECLDLTTVAGLQQVQLQVKVAEVSRTVTRMLSSDFAFSDFTTSFAVNNAASGTFLPTTPVGNLQRSLPGGTTIFGSGAIGGTTFEYFVQALAENQYLRILAEPTLVARSGQEAHFLAGGEIPIPIAQVGGGNTTEISIEYKEFGVRLSFTPTVLGDGRIELKVAPEVSQLSDVGAVELLGTSIPSLLTRRVETTLELQTGQTFAIAGLLDQNENASVSKIPMIGDVPVIGALFRSVRYTRDDTEMVVLVTASLVEASSNDLDPPVPGDFHVMPNDWELYVEGRVEGRATVRLAPTQRERLRKLGLDKLEGPGAWASYEEMPDSLAGQKRATTK